MLDIAVCAIHLQVELERPKARALQGRNVLRQWGLMPCEQIVDRVFAGTRGSEFGEKGPVAALQGERVEAGVRRGGRPLIPYETM